MKYKALILDLDNTLYDYDLANNHAIAAIESHLVKEGILSSKDFSKAHALARVIVKKRLIDLPASHHKLLQFKEMLYSLGLFDSRIIQSTYELYKTEFLKKCVLFEFWRDCLNKYDNVVILTDYVLDFQLDKINHLAIPETVKIIASEEFGLDKPSACLFEAALDLLKVNEENVLMIGDSYEKDILGAKILGIDSFHLNKECRESGFIKLAELLEL